MRASDKVLIDVAGCRMTFTPSQGQSWSSLHKRPQICISYRDSRSNVQVILVANKIQPSIEQFFTCNTTLTWNSMGLEQLILLHPCHKIKTLLFSWWEYLFQKKYFSTKIFKDYNSPACLHSSPTLETQRSWKRIKTFIWEIENICWKVLAELC